MRRSSSKLRFLLASGPTREPIDPVRYIANRSSGKQGFAVAGALAALGAELEALFDLGYHTKHVDTIFKRVFGE